LPRAAHGRDLGAEVLGELDGEGAHPAGRAGDQHLLAGLDLAVVAQPLQGRDGRDRDRGGLLEAHVRRLGDQAVLAGDHELGEGAGAPAEHLVAGPEAGHVRADGLDDARHVAADAGALRTAHPYRRGA
jgi:hypothetical protein